MEIKIEKNIPIPPVRRKGNGLYAEAARSMKVGDSFAVPVEKGKPFPSLKVCADRATRGLGYKFVGRVVIENDVKVVRLWRTA